MQTSIRAIQKLNPDDIDIQESQFNEWKFWTRRLIWRFGWLQISLWVDHIAKEDAEEYWENWIPPEIKEPSFSSKTTLIKLSKTLSKIKITDIAKKYGLKVKGNKAMCPFHEGNSPSLSFSNEKALFNCFGCEAKGDLITLVRMLEDLKK